MPERQTNFFQLFLYAALAILTVEVVFLISQNRDLKAQLESINKPPETLKVGDAVDAFTVFKLTGDSTVVDYAASGKETMLWFYTTTCPACKANTAVWKDLYQKNLTSSRYTIIPISLDSIEVSKKYASEMNLPYETYSLQRRQAVTEKYKVFSIPQTIVVGADGVVKEVMVGVIKDEDKAKLISQSGK